MLPGVHRHTHRKCLSGSPSGGRDQKAFVQFRYFWYYGPQLRYLSFFVCFREFIKMGFVDKNRVAIWGWVCCQDFVLTHFYLRGRIFKWKKCSKNETSCMSHVVFHSSEGNKRLWKELMFDPSVSVIGLYLRVRVKMSYTDELFIFHSLMGGTWRQWPWDLEVEFSNAEWQSRQSPNGNIMVFFVFLSRFFMLTTFPHLVHFNDTQCLQLSGCLFQIPSTQSVTWCSLQRIIITIL